MPLKQRPDTENEELLCLVAAAFLGDSACALWRDLPAEDRINSAIADAKEFIRRIAQESREHA